MMAIARFVIGSLVAHAVVFAALVLLVDERSPAKHTKRTPAVELVEPVTEIAVVVVPPEPPVIAPAPTEHAKSRSRVPAPAIATTLRSEETIATEPTAPTEPTEPTEPSGATAPTASTEPTEPTDPTEPTEPSGATGPIAPTGPGRSMNMRARGGGPDLAIHADVLHEEAPVTPQVKADKKLQQNGTEFVVPDLVTTMHVSRDGRARFVDKPDMTVEIRIPMPPSAKEIGDHLHKWYRDPYAQKFARRYQDMPRHEQAVPGGWDAGAGGDANVDGSIKGPEQQPRATGGTVPLIGGKLDITSWLHRKLIGDPYASRKRVLLDGTHEERARVRERYTREQLDDSAITMQKNVDRVFRAVRDPAARRATLFALWDECAEGDGDAGAAGQRARAIVIGAIRGRLGDRYSGDEIAALDAQRTSVQHFAPYD